MTEQFTPVIELENGAVRTKIIGDPDGEDRPTVHWQVRCPECEAWWEVDSAELHGQKEFLCSCSFDITQNWIREAYPNI